MVPWRFSWNEIKRRPGRSLLTLGSVVIGVATLLAVSISVATTRRAFQEMYQTLAGRAALEVRSDSGEGIDADLLPVLDSTPGVKAAVPVLQRQTVLIFHSQRIETAVLGIDPERDVQARDYVFEAGHSFPHGNEILLEAGFAKNIGAKVGDRVILLTYRGPRAVTLVGLLAPRGAAAFHGGGIVFMSLRRAQLWYRAVNQVDTIYLVLNDGVPEDRVTKALAGRLPKGLTASPPATRTEMARETLMGIEQGLSLTGALSLVAAAFIVINSFFINLAERRRQLATLRAIGAARWQVLSLVLREGLLLGVAGTLLGIVAGIGAALLMTRAMESVFNTTLPAFQVSLGSVLAAALLGPLLAVGSVLLPGWNATRISPLEGMRRAPVDTPPRSRRWTTWIGLTLTAVSFVAGAMIYKAVLPPPSTSWVVVIGLVGMSLLMPLLLAPIVWLVSGVLVRLLGVNALLACRQILRQRTRSSLTAGVLFVAVVMSVAMGNSVLNNTQNIRNWVRRALVGDLFIRSVMMIDMTTGESPAIPEGVLEQVRAVPGITSLEPWTFARTRAQGQLVLVVARTFPRDAPLSLDLRGADPEEVHRRLFQGEVVISTVLARRMGRAVGDEITMATKQGTQQLRVAGVVDDYLMGGTVMYLQTETAAKLLGLRGIHALVIRVAPERRAEVEAALRVICQNSGVLLHSMADLVLMIDNLMAGVYAAMWAMLAAGFVVAAFGVVNTLTMNVLEQTRELGMSRIVGMSRGQVRKYIVSQAAVIGVVGLLPGAAVGQMLAWVINRVTDPLLGHPVQFAARPELIAACIGFALLITVVAAFLPAERAARMAIAEAVQYE